MARLWVLLVLGLALGAWWWILDRSLKNERELVAARLAENRQERFQRALGTVAEGLERDSQEALAHLAPRPTTQLAAQLMEKRRVSAVLYPDPPFTPTPGDLPSLTWGSDEEGRDFVTSALLPRLAESEVRQLLRPRLLGQTGPPMKASFRHRALTLYLAVASDPLLEKLARMEGLRAAGTPPEASLLLEAGELTLCWDEEELERRFLETGVTVRLGPEGQRFTRWDSPLRASLVPEPLDATLPLEGATPVRWIGLGSGLLFALAVLGALWSGWQDRNLARLRTDLATSVAHELRTPLAGQRVLLETLAESPLSQPAQPKEYLQLAVQANQRLAALAEQFLTFSRLDRGILAIERETFCLRALMEELLAQRTAAFDEVNLALPDPFPVHLDPHATRSILSNLIENAWKYSPGEKWLALRASRQVHLVQIEVEDRGPGLDPQEQRRVFRKFWRAETGLDRQVDGLGLGLTIVAELAKAHGGHVEVASARGQGSRFRVQLPELPLP
ncbi:MAG: HAMP domain-containing sensor histidine kinase [Verrucomicrobiota bacterium]